MGLFDPPTVTIAKYAPASVQPILATVRIFAESQIPDSIGRTKKALVTAMVMGAWINAHAQTASFDMSQRDLDKALNLYKNCAAMVGPDGDFLGPILEALFDAGMLPDVMRDVFKPRSGSVETLSQVGVSHPSPWGTEGLRDEAADEHSTEDLERRRQALAEKLNRL